MSAEKERRKPEREHARAGEVERVPAMLDVLVQGDDEERRGRDPCRDVDEEDPPPGEVLDDDPAEERTDEPGDAPHRAEDALHPAALFQVVDVADDGEGRRLHRSGPEPLHGAEGDERADPLREPARHRADEEDGDAGEEHRLAPVEIGELAVDGDRHRRGEQVRGEDPGVVVDAAEIADYGRHGRGDNRHLHRSHRQAEEERDDGERAIRLHRPW